MCKLTCALWICLLVSARSLQEQRVGGLTEVYAWKQITYNIEGTVWNSNSHCIVSRADKDPRSLSEDKKQVTRDRASASGLGGERRNKRQSDFVFLDRDDDYDRDSRITRFPSPHHNYNYQGYNFSNNRIDTPTPRPINRDEPSTFFIQYNNVPMGAEKVGHRLFVALPRRRYGIPSTLNYVDLRTDVDRSPHLRPYPNLRESRDLVSVYRTRADECGRLWMVDTGLLEIPDQPQQVQPPAIVIYDLTTNMQILRYQIKESHLPANNTPTGLASITVDTSTGCSDTFAYIPDLTTFGIIVFSLRQRDSWRVTHSYMHFNPLAVNLNIAGQTFQWSDGIFSITLGRGRCAPAYFHPLISWQEFSVSSCVLRNSTAASDSNYWTSYSLVGERGPNSQSTMHDIHKQSGVLFFAEVGRNSMSCWDSNRPLSPDTVAVLATDQNRLSYPADLHVTDQQVWLIANKLPRYSYSSLNTNEYNFFVYKANVEELIYGTVCSSRTHPAAYSNTRDSVY